MKRKKKYQIRTRRKKKNEKNKKKDDESGSEKDSNEDENNKEKKHTKVRKERSQKNGKKNGENVVTSIFDLGGLMARNPDTNKLELVFLGIIDNLTAYTLNKQLANFFKSFLWDPETLSTVRSEFYADRFTSFMTKNLLADEEEVDLGSDEEKEFRDHVEKMEKTGKIPAHRPEHLGTGSAPASQSTVHSIVSPRAANSPPRKVSYSANHESSEKKKKQKKVKCNFVTNRM